MKKVYNKPTAMIEVFQVNEYIAGSCGDNLKVNFTQETCMIELDGTNFFSDFCVAEDEDAVNVPNPGNGGTICYHTPENTWNFFSS